MTHRFRESFSGRLWKDLEGSRRVRKFFCGWHRKRSKRVRKRFAVGGIGRV
jgi:hypothetical protein